MATGATARTLTRGLLVVAAAVWAVGGVVVVVVVVVALVGAVGGSGRSRTRTESVAATEHATHGSLPFWHCASLSPRTLSAAGALLGVGVRCPSGRRAVPGMMWLRMHGALCACVGLYEAPSRVVCGAGAARGAGAVGEVRWVGLCARRGVDTVR